ncbi:MAG: acyl-CoA thioesterase [candidate division Zixibacteria bacterium]|nr:acyl-CoA thioesterase [candidate division Zixibacteria bacterium]
MEAKPVSQSRTTKAMLVLPPDSNALGTMFGGKVMSNIDDVASISAFRHARQQVVTASTDSVDFLRPITVGHMVCLESFVTWTHRTSMEVYVRVISEDLKTGERITCATSFLTFVAIDEHGRTREVPPVQPTTDFEKELHASAPDRFKRRMERKEHSRKLAEQYNSRKK